MAVSKNVTVIPARKHTRKSKDEEKPKLRVAAYCRVSTDSDKDTFLSTLRDNITTVINRESDKELAYIDKRLKELQTELLKLATSNADYEKVGDEIHRLRDKKQKLQVENVNRDELKKRMAEMSTFLKKQSTALTEYDEQLVRRLIEKVTVYEDKFTVEFKSGVTVDVNE